MKKMLFLALAAVAAMPVEAVEFMYTNMKYKTLGETTNVEVLPTGNYRSGTWSVAQNPAYNNVTYTCIRVGNQTFKNQTLSVIGLPSTIVEIGYQAFMNTKNVSSINLPASLTTIEKQAFDGSGITSLGIPASVTSIGVGAFANCSKLSGFMVPGNSASFTGTSALFNKALTRVIAVAGGVENTVFPISVTAIDSMAFDGCKSTLHVTCLGTTPATVTTPFPQGLLDSATILVPAAALATYKADPQWGKFKNIVAGQGSDDFVKFSFVSANIRYTTTSPTTVEANKYLSTMGGSWSISNPQYLGTAYITTSIADNAFANFPMISSFGISPDVKKIGKACFLNDAGLTAISLPTPLEQVGEKAFYNCNKITSLAIPAKVSSIGNGAFSCMKSLSTLRVDANNQYFRTNGMTLVTKDSTEVVMFGNSIKGGSVYNKTKKIRAYAFDGCTVMETLQVPVNVPPVVETAFPQEMLANCVLTVPAGTASAYKNAPYWSAFQNITDGTTAITEIDAQAAPATYYDLQGRRILEPAQGLYIKVQGGKATKVKVER